MKPYKVPLGYYTSEFADGRFTVNAINDIIDTDSATRSLTLEIRHPGLIWTSKFSRFIVRDNKSIITLAHLFNGNLYLEKRKKQLES